MYRGLIVEMKSGITAPDDFLNTAVEKFPMAYGIAFALNGEVQTASMVEKPTLKDVKDFRELSGDKMLFWFGRDDGINLDSCMPQPVLFDTDGKKILLAAFINGEFDRYKNPESPNTTEFFLAKTFLLPKFTSLQRMLKGDMKAIVDEMQQPHFAGEILNAANSDGPANVIVMASTGDIIKYTRDPANSTTDFGWVSDKIGWGAKAAESGPDTRSAAQKKADEIRARASGGKPVTVPAVNPAEIKPVEKPVEETNPLPDEKNVEALTDRQEPEFEIVLMKPPTEIQHKNNLRDWYIKRAVDPQTGKLLGSQEGVNPPPGYKQARPACYVKREKAQQVASAPEVKNETIMGSAINKAKEVLGLASEKKDQGPTSPVAAKVLPVISMGQEARVREEFLGDPKLKQQFIGLGAEEINDPSKIILTNVPSFSARFGPVVKNLTDTVNWTPETYLRLIREFPETAVLLMINYKNSWINMAAKTKTPLYVDVQEKKSA